MPQLDKRLPAGHAIRNEIIADYRNNARRKGIDYALSEAVVVCLLEGSCYYCGQPPKTLSSPENWDGGYLHNGIDRLDSELGYTLGNSVSCCAKCNYLKNHYSFAKFSGLVQQIASYENPNSDYSI